MRSSHNGPKRPTPAKVIEQVSAALRSGQATTGRLSDLPAEKRASVHNGGKFRWDSRVLRRDQQVGLGRNVMSSECVFNFGEGQTAASPLLLPGLLARQFAWCRSASELRSPARRRTSTRVRRFPFRARQEIGVVEILYMAQALGRLLALRDASQLPEIFGSAPRPAQSRLEFPRPIPARPRTRARGAVAPRRRRPGRPLAISVPERSCTTPSST